MQLKDIAVATKEDGTHIFTKRGARQFLSPSRDDLALASMLCYGAFLKGVIFTRTALLMGFPLGGLALSSGHQPQSISVRRFMKSVSTFIV